MRGKYGTISERKLQQAGGERDGAEEFEIIKLKEGVWWGTGGVWWGEGGVGGSSLLYNLDASLIFLKHTYTHTQCLRAHLKRKPTEYLRDKTHLLKTFLGCPFSNNHA